MLLSVNEAGNQFRYVHRVEVKRVQLDFSLVKFSLESFMAMQVLLEVCKVSIFRSILFQEFRIKFLVCYLIVIVVN